MRIIKILSLLSTLVILVGCGGSTGTKSSTTIKTNISKVWGTPMKLAEVQNGTIFKPKVALNSKGDKVVIWEQNDEIYAKFYNSSKGWSKTNKVTNTGFLKDSKKIVLDDSGNAMVVWRRETPTINYLYASRYSKNSGWSKPLEIDSGNYNVYMFNIAIDGSGNVFVLWDQQNSSNETNLYFRKYNKQSSSWSSYANIENSPGDITNLKLAVNSNGDLAILWIQDEIIQSVPHIRRYNHATNNWENIKVLNSSPSTNISVAINDNSQVVAIWDQLNSASKNEIMAQVYIPSSGWNNSKVINTVTGTLSNLELTIDSGGNAYSTWEDDNLLTAIKYDSTKSAWENPKSLYTVFDSQLLTNSKGDNIMAVNVIKNSANKFNLFATQFSNKNSNWSSKESIENINNDTYEVDSEMDKYGNVTAVFISDKPKYTLYVNEYE